MKIVCTKVNRLEPPHEVQEFLADYGGRNLNGDPNFRLVWSNSRTSTRTKRFIDTDIHGNVLRETIETREVLKYGLPKLRDRFIIEQWYPASHYGSPEYWQRSNSQWQDGRLIQPIGGYPARGDYEYVDVVEWFDESGQPRFAWPTRTYVRHVVDTVRYLKGLTYGQVAAELQNNDLRKDTETENYYLDRVKDASRPFGGIQPFVSLAGLSAPN